MKKEPKLKDCANENCDKQFRQFKSTIKVCSMICAIEYAEQKREKEESKEWNKEKSQRNIDLMSTNQYRKTYIQPLINHLARIIDNGQDCIANPGRKTVNPDAGHRHSVGSNLTLALNLHNIFAQSVESNHHQGGDHIKFRYGLKLMYGNEYADFIDETLMQCPNLHLTKEDLIEVKPRLQKMVNYYKKLNKVYTPLERIKLRNQLNEELNIYPEEFATFNY